MVHPEREFGIICVESTDKLAMILTGFTWTLCTGFEHQGLLFLNDSSRVDSVQEYAVVKSGLQVESITFGWCSEEEASHHIRELLAGELKNMGLVQLTTSPASGHTCPLCQ